MTHRSPPPRNRQPATEAPPCVDGATLSRQDRSTAQEAAILPTPPSPDAAEPPPGPSNDWRAKLTTLVQAAALSPSQETDCFRLFQAQETELREAMPQLLAELRPHLETAGEAEAKERFMQALHALKRRQEEDVTRLLASMGFEPPPRAE